MKTILAPTDFSSVSVHAVNYAMDMAVDLNAELMLVNVVEVPLLASEMPIAESVFENMLSMAKSDLDELAAGLREKSSGKINIRTEVTIGTVATAIDDFAQSVRPFVIVMGMHPEKSLDRILSGSVTLRLISHHVAPVLIVPENVPYRRIAKAGLACDLVNVADTIPHQLLNDWLSAYNPSLDIIHLGRNEQDLDATAAGESISLQNHFKKFNPAFHYLAGKGLSKSLNEFSSEHKLDLLIVVPKKHGILEIFDKKHSKEIIEHQQAPILAAHAL